MAFDSSFLALTHEAAQAIREIVADEPASGLRISRTGSPPGALLLSLVSAPHPGDHVVWRDGVSVFIDQSLTECVAGRLMDVEVNPQGVARFFLSERATAT